MTFSDLLAVTLPAEVPFLEAPDGPNDPFGSPLVSVFDSVRVLFVFIPGLVNMLGIPHLIAYRSIPRGQKRWFVALTLLSATACATELDHFGDYGHYRLFVNALALSLTALTTVRVLRSRSSGKLSIE